ncbi:uncharacterized protein BXZ73DRAFT_92638 [Epithele typhae]|uniref:uncharacterized protein n=1 Tax=Epithele typhae TaxID=378194 RepID=UPI00200739CF|nr:uncharacterized protein BXZ73DRAFT_92638 [Epithele typhae]KAH9915247.1 hypothetical protein BXZ73DRAFT_92638 [Epithele typhae]
MATPLAQHEDNIFISVTLSPASALLSHPDALLVHPLITRLGRVGELQDSWPQVETGVLDALNSLPGVLRVDVQGLPKLRAKRGGDEL